MKEKRIITILMVFTVIFTFFGASLAYWNWETSEAQRTSVVFTVGDEFKCAADGGGDITSEQVSLVPTDCTNTEYAIQRTVTVSPSIYKDDLSVYMDLWLQINSIGSGLSNSENFRYALTTSPTSCTTGVVSEGNFNGKTNVEGNNTVQILAKSYTATITETYYLYIWLDKAETSQTTMNQSFDLSLNGNCTNDPYIPSEGPVLDEGMIPVTISEDGVVTTVAKNDSSWYDYENKEWANVVLVKDEGTQTRDYYKSNTGKTVNQDDILAYYVWIPRYKYRIPEIKCSTISDPTVESNPECYVPYTMADNDKTALIAFVQNYVTNVVGISDFTSYEATTLTNEALQTGYFNIGGGVLSLPDAINTYNSQTGSNITYTGAYDDNNTVAGPKTIDIAFETADSSAQTGDAVNTYYTHPAFIWNGSPVAGIWVGKFETGHSSLSSSTADNNLGCSDENCTNADGLIIKPNVQSLRYNNLSNFYYASRAMAKSGNSFGLNVSTTDSHIMKNSEWGAVVYLSHSQYGINQEIYINNSSSYYTGRSGGNVGGSAGEATYGTYTWTGQEINSSGTIGSYATDRTLGTNASTTGNVTGVYDMSGGAWEYVMGNHSNYGTPGTSGFTSVPGIPYINLYASAVFGTSDLPMSLCTLAICGGHALNETATWYGDYAGFVSYSGVWFGRGGSYNDGAYAGIFYSGSSNGYADSNNASRSVLVVGNGA